MFNFYACIYIDYRIKILRFLLVLPYKCTCTCTCTCTCFHSDNHYYLIQHWTRQYGSRCGHCWLVSRKSRSVVSSCEFFLAFPVPWMVSYGQRGWKNWKRFISTACLTNEVKGPTIQYIKILVHVVGWSTLELDTPSIDFSWCNQIRSLCTCMSGNHLYLKFMYAAVPLSIIVDISRQIYHIKEILDSYVPF